MVESVLSLIDPEGTRANKVCMAFLKFITTLENEVNGSIDNLSVFKAPFEPLSKELRKYTKSITDLLPCQSAL